MKITATIVRADGTEGTAVESTPSPSRIIAASVNRKATAGAEAFIADSLLTLSAKAISRLTDPTDGQSLVFDAALDKWRPGTAPSTVQAFVDLSDVPSSYSGAGGKLLAVNSTADGVEFRSLIAGDIPDLSTTYQLHSSNLDDWSAIATTAKQDHSLNLDAWSAIATSTKQDTIDLGTTAQYFRGDLSLATFPTNVSSFTNDAGYLTGVTVNAPLSGAGTSASHLSMHVADTTHDGYLSSTDWNTFNNKQPAGSYESPLTFQYSLSRSTNTVTLSGDSATPGNSKYYGTNGSGTRGFYDLPTTDLSNYQTLDGTLALAGFSSITGRIGSSNLPLGAQLYDNAGTPKLAADFDARKFYAPDGSTIAFQLTDNANWDAYLGLICHDGLTIQTGAEFLINQWSWDPSSGVLQYYGNVVFDIDGTSVNVSAKDFDASGVFYGDGSGLTNVPFTSLDFTSANITSIPNRSFSDLQNINGLQLYDNAGTPKLAADFGARQLIANDGTTIPIDWSDPALIRFAESLGYLEYVTDDPDNHYLKLVFHRGDIPNVISVFQPGLFEMDNPDGFPTVDIDSRYDRIKFNTLPTSDPTTTGQLWNNNGVLTVSGTSLIFTGNGSGLTNLPKTFGNLGMVTAVEAYVSHDVSTGSLPDIDGYQTIENDRVYLGAQSNTIENGIWIVHESSAWERPPDFADGKSIPSGQIVYCRGGNGNTQFNSVWIQVDNASNDQIPFTVGTDPINSLSIQPDGSLPPLGFPNVPQGPYLPASWFGATDASSDLGAGQPLFLAAYTFAATGMDFGGGQLVNAVFSGDGSGLTSLSTSQITDSTDKRFVTDAQLTVLGNTSGTNSGDQYGGVTASGALQYLRRNAGNTAYEFGALPDYSGTYQPLDAALTTLAAGSDFVQFTGPTTSTKVFTLPNSSATLLYSGGALGTPASGDLSSCTFPTLNQNTTGSAAKWTTARNLAGNSIDGSANVAFANKFIVQGTSDSGLSAAQFLGSLGTGIVKNTTTTGVLSIAVAGDFPTLNQNTTGSAATLTTARAIYGNNFDGSADLTQVIASTYGGTGNGFTKFTGPTTSEKTFTLPNSSATLLYSGISVIDAGTGFTIGNAAASGKILVGNGTNFVASTPTFPNASATSGKVIKSDGTNWVASTETYAAPGATGAVLQSDGTNWVRVLKTVAVSGTASSTTNNTAAETNLFTVTIPAGAMNVNGNLRITVLWKMTGTNGTKTPVIRHNTTSGATSGGTVLWSIADAAGTLTHRVVVDVWNVNSASSQIFYPHSNANSLGTNSNAPETGGIDTSQISYLNFNAFVANSGDTIGVVGYTVEIINP